MSPEKCNSPSNERGAERKHSGGDKPTAPPVVAAKYTYCDRPGKMLFQVVRYEPKAFAARRAKGNGWETLKGDLPTIPYHFPELLSNSTLTVFVAMSEKHVEWLESFGVVATCCAGGAGKWSAEHAKYLKDRCVVVLASNSDAGRQDAHRIAETLRGFARSIKVLDLPGIAEGEDTCDWIANGGTKEDLQRLAAATPEWSTEPATEAWPEIDPLGQWNLPTFPTEALHPVLQQWVEAISNATQTPPCMAALLSLAVCAALLARRDC